MSAETHNRLVTKFGAVAVGVLFVVETITNAVFGYREAGVALAAVFASLAVFGALCGINYVNRQMGAERVAFAAGAILCFLVSQIAANSVFSTMLADGGVRRSSEAASGAASREALQLLRDEQRKIGVTRPVATIAAEENLECRKTSPAYKDGVGPNCTRLRAELKTAERAAALPGLITAADAKIQKGPQKADGEGFIGQLKWLLSLPFGEFSDDTLRRGFVAFLALVLGIAANFGPAMLLSHASGSVAGDAVRAASPAARLSPPSHAGAAAWVAPEAKPLAVQPIPSASSQTLAPVNNYYIGAAPIDRSAPDAQIAIEQPVPTTPLKPMPSATSSPVAAPAVPVDRTMANQIMDQLLAFRAACVAAVDGDVLPADTLYERYQAWAGGRALDASAFHSLFGPLNNVPRCRVGDVEHYYGVTLRADHPPQLALVG